MNLDPNVAYADLIGQPFHKSMLKRFNIPKHNVRVYDPRAIYPASFNLFRLNVQIDENGVIEKFFFG